MKMKPRKLYHSWYVNRNVQNKSYVTLFHLQWVIIFSTRSKLNSNFSIKLSICDFQVRLQSRCMLKNLIFSVTIRPGTHYPHVTWAHVMLRVQLGCERRFNIEFYSADSHFCHSAYITWSHVELWSAHVPAGLSHFCCRTHFMRRELRVECSSDIVTSCFQKWRKCLLKKCTNGPFYMMPSHQITEISIWEPTHEKRVGRS